MKKWQELALKYHSNGLRPFEVVKKIEEELNVINMYDKVYSYIKRHGGKNKSEPDKKPVVFENRIPNVIQDNWDGSEILIFGLIGDTHIGSKYTQLSHLHRFYDICHEKGVKNVYHSGDITDGLKMRPGHEYEVYDTSADEMKDDVVRNYPKYDDIVTHFITGNHDASIYKHIGHDIGYAIAKERPDLNYLGRDCAVVNLTPNCTLELRHPWDGCAYALSYKVQKMVEAMESDSKPKILAVGHYHKASFFFYRNVHIFQTGCFESQTPFTRGKGISIHLGGWIVTAKVDKDGTILNIVPEFIPFYNAITNDYKKYQA